MKCKSKTARDEEYIKAYLETHSTVKASKICGVSYETIARAVRRADIKLDGRKHNDGKTNGQLKITDEELIAEAETLSGKEIAQKYNIDLVNIYRRAKKLGLPIHGDGNKWKDRCKRYGVTEFDESITLDAVVEKYNGICQLCGKPIDKSDIKDGHVRKMYPSVDHVKPLSKGGSHTWDNIQLAHIGCNAKKCANYVE